ncbi:pyruvate, water dikinase regulatory protein [Paenibacillus donghaensis]|uniref:Putative pyruvate, phosphate dikinase regulatory protein n=1 Tax=Paenibacillus donghaensis TaxID=414771 RepID=A0A2Z2KT27_9BACL|nr:pyruvate, water dikinase regulatory protein [Paenibacillus donghaensis]ASA26249.1 phosphoenolpyruvate synthase regulatory protein [Paenibacillus donghaensis]
MTEKHVFICSDSIGETAEAVAGAAIRQFNLETVAVRPFRRITSVREIADIVELAHRQQSVIVYTLVQQELREAIARHSLKLGVAIVDVMGPVITAFSQSFHHVPLQQPGRHNDLDDHYYRRIEAIEFAVKYDDGRDGRGIGLADLVLVGVSRTSKTPLSMYMAYKGIKVANCPLTPEVPPPPELLQVPRNRIFGLTMDMEALIKIRTERLRALGLTTSAGYASELQVLEEYSYAEELMKKLGCKIIDVTNQSIEESAGLILDCL